LTIRHSKFDVFLHSQYTDEDRYFSSELPKIQNCIAIVDEQPTISFCRAC
jgi:hypothetical protein